MAVSLEEIETEWNNFKETHKKEYSSEVEESKRKEIFKKNLIKIREHNKKFEEGSETFKMGINHFADLEQHEVAKGFGKGVPSKK